MSLIILVSVLMHVRITSALTFAYACDNACLLLLLVFVHVFCRNVGAFVCTAPAWCLRHCLCLNLSVLMLIPLLMPIFGLVILYACTNN